MTRRFHWLLIGLMLICSGAASSTTTYKVLVVMSYEEDNPWCQAIRAGIESELASSSDITYFYMDTKINPAGGPDKAQEALAVYTELQPHGVITADDNAQSMFVVPFLKDRVDTPVMFSGVNAAADKYGYPNSHISGILERAHVRESLAFAKLLLPKINSACFITNDVPSGRALQKQVESEKDSYPLRVGGYYPVKNTAQLQSLENEIKSSCDTLFVDSLEGIVDDRQQPLNNREVINYISRIYDTPILGGNRYQVEQGAWAAVVKTGHEQGQTAAKMLLEAMRGKPVAELAVTENSRGERILNVSALEKHDVPLKPLVLRGATLIKEQL